MVIVPIHKKNVLAVKKSYKLAQGFHFEYHGKVPGEIVHGIR